MNAARGRGSSWPALALLAMVAAVPVLQVACAQVAGIDQLELAACKGGAPCPVPGAGGGDPSSTNTTTPTGSSTGPKPNPTGSGSSSATATSDKDASPPPPFTCPTGTKGAVLVRAGSATNPFCIDATETTVAQYREFTDSSPDVGAQPSECAWNDTFAPGGTASSDDLPQVQVDWCDARAYCAWAGKRLCGKVLDGADPGKPLLDSEINSPNVDAWYIACSKEGSRSYPYGSSLISQACNLSDGKGGGAMVRQSPGTSAGCVGGYDGIFDMVGNVWEWSDNCFLPNGAGSSAPENWLCPARGGGYTQSETETTCTARGALSQRQAKGDYTGFRCCSK